MRRWRVAPPNLAEGPITPLRQAQQASHAAGAPAGAPWEARARAARVQTAGEDLWWVGGGGSKSELPQAGFP